MTADPLRTPTRAEFSRMAPADVNAFLASRGLAVRVLSPDELRAPGTDDEPWTWPVPEPVRSRLPDVAAWSVVALIIAAVVLVALATWRRR